MKEMLVTSMSHTSLTCQHENFSLLLLPQQETQKCPNADKPITGQDAVQKPLLGYRWTSRIRATPTAWTGQTEQGWQAPTHMRLEWAPARFLNSDCPQAPCCLQPTATTPVLATSGTEAAGWNSLTTPTRVGLAVHDTAVLTFRNTRIRGVTTAVWLGMLLLQLGMELHITNLSNPRRNTSYLEQSSLISEPKL